MGLAMLLARQFQNGALARYPDAARELAVFAYATSVFFLFHAALGFVSQMSNALARTREAHRTALGFTVGAGLALSTPLVFLAFTTPGESVLASLFDIRGETLADVVRYLRYLTPLVLVNGLRQYYTGMLIQVKRTGIVTALNVAHLLSIGGLLVLGFHLEWRAVETLARAQVASALIHLALSVFAMTRLYTAPGGETGPPLTYRRTFDFFWPVAVTAVMFAISRPLIYSFASRTPDAIATIAALRVAFDFAMIFHLPLNQFRHLFITFGTRDLPGVRRFLVTILVAVTVLMVVFLASPLGRWTLHGLLGVKGDLLEDSIEAVWVLCLIPLVVSARNYFHGLSLARKRTGSMAVGGILRVLFIGLASWGLLAAGRLDHVFGAAILVAGFAVEAATVVALGWKGRASEGGDVGPGVPMELDDA